ncbi:OSIGBa0102B11.2 protein, related [Eimeria praecox]|uniref:OSIGBa0102B11.2 protein, related n=1 Tax=Eimeria praecox TaxID=51316 RepID=U6G3P7_9EIME|nr:OSIGBa0102B11.2 protein, related [Eimeria praecox]
MPFGLKGAPGTFQANINAYSQPLLGHGVIAYLDDVLIYSADLPAHVVLLRKVLSTFLTNQFYPKIRKCQFARQELTYLGYTISAEGIKPATDKIEAIRVWPEVVENETQVRQFLCTVNYCRMFMGPDYADISRPLVTLIRKDTPFHWTDAQTQAVRQLKRRLIDYTTLQVPDTSKPFELYTDAPGYAIGGVLEQAGEPIGFLSQAMTPVQQKYSIYDQELLALVTALDKWSHRLRVAKANESSPDDTEPSAIPSVRPAVSATLDWPAAYAKCPVFRVPYNTAVQAAGATVQVEFRNRLLAFRFVPPFLSVCLHRLWRICVPQFPEFLTHILYNHHDHVTAEHRGQKRTFLSLSKLYYWPGVRTYTIAYVESCTQCRASKSLNQKPAVLLQQLIIPSRRSSHVSLDFITDLPLTTTGHDSILVLVDSLSKMAHFVPAKKTFTAVDTVDVLADRLIRYHGLPEVLMPDRDPGFQSDLWQQLCARFNIKRALSSSYHPQSDGQTERVNRTLEQMLRTHIQSDEREWERLLPALELAYNTASHSSTELSPFEVFVPDRPRAPAQEPQEAVVEWPPTRVAAGNPTDQYEVDYIMDQPGSGDEAYYLVKWRDFPEDKATWEPTSHLEGCPTLLRSWRRRQRNRGPP